ncbi:MAG: hypothetical protein H7834_08950 [Magnetococcus sp. YQC-9]
MIFARSSKEAFFAKNAPHAAFASFVSAFWKRSSHNAHGLAENETLPKMVEVYLCLRSSSISTANMRQPATRHISRTIRKRPLKSAITPSARQTAPAR